MKILPPQVLALMQQLPKALHPVVIAFPPGSVVRARARIGTTLPKHRQVPKGDLCHVMSYQEADHKFPDGVVWIARQKQSDALTPARPKDLEWMSNDYGLDRVWTAALLAKGES
jgi:hypothetical protein